VDIQQLLPYAPWLAAALALAVGFVMGRAGQGPKRRRELEGELSVLRGLEEEGRSTREDLERRLADAGSEAEVYKKKVVDHFYGTSEQLRSLTLQYRSVFDHLADGARELCPDEIGQLDGEFGVPVLDAGEALEVDASPDVSVASESESESEPETEAEVSGDGAERQAT
jgi:uncharacterized membrane-anchored protein YhcB (DUF1043 family)